MGKKSHDASLADSLMRLGVGRVEATLVSCMVADSPVPTKLVVERTGLRQPEVSVGMRTLRERGWVVSEPIPREGKGRPMHRYKLSIEAQAIYEHYANEAHQAIQEKQAALDAFAKRLPVSVKDGHAVGARHERSVAHS